MTIIYFIAILGLTVLVHEFGHFIFAKKSGVYCYEFSIGMGPKLFSFKGKKGDETLYSVRLLPIGGYVQMAGEEVDDDKEVPKNRKMQSKTFWQRFKIIVAGAVNNFILGFILLLLMALIYGGYDTRPIVGDVNENYNAYKLNIKSGDLIIKMNDKKISSTSDALLRFQLVKKGSPIKFTLKDKNGDIRSVTVKPILDEKTNSYVYGIGLSNPKTTGFVNSIKYAVNEFKSMYKSMYLVISNLITGDLGLNSLSGPVGIYKVVGQESKQGFDNIMYLAAFISVNVGFVNLLPFPALDGGRVLFLIIEKIRKKQLSQKVENTVNMIGFGLLMLLVLVITIKDIIKLF